MSFAENFAVSQGSNITTFTITDTSIGTDANIVSRRVCCQLYDGSYLVPAGITTNYTPFPIVNLAGDTLSLAILNQDYALSIKVEWWGISSVLYSKTALYGFPAYSQQFLYYLTQQQAAAYPAIIQDTNYYNNKFILFQLVNSGNNAVDSGGDIYSAQICYDAAAQMIANKAFNF